MYNKRLITWDISKTQEGLEGTCQEMFGEIDGSCCVYLRGENFAITGTRLVGLGLHVGLSTLQGLF